MDADEVIVLKSYKVKQIIVTTEEQLIKFRLTENITIEAKITENRRLEIKSHFWPLGLQPIAERTVEIYPVTNENYFYGEKPQPQIYNKGDYQQTKKIETQNPRNEKADEYGVTLSKMTMKEKKP